MSKMITNEQIAELEYEARNYPDILHEMMDTFGFVSYDDIPKSRYATLLRRLRETIKIRDGL